MNVTIYESHDMYGEHYFTFDDKGDPVGEFVLEDTGVASFELIRNEDGQRLVIAHTSECDFPVEPRKAGNGRFYATPVGIAGDTKAAWLKRAE